MVAASKLGLLLFAGVAVDLVIGGDAPDPRIGDSSIDMEDIVIENEADALSMLTELRTQLDAVLSRLPDDGEPDEIDVVVSESEGSGSTSNDEWIDEEIVVDIAAASGSGPRLTEDEKYEVEEEVVGEVAETLNAELMDEFLQDAAAPGPLYAVVPPIAAQENGGPVDPRFKTLVEKEDEAFAALTGLGEQLDDALQSLPNDGKPAEIDVVLNESSDVEFTEGGNGKLEGEIVVEIAASSSSGPRLTDEEKELLEDEIIDEVAGTLDAAIMDEFPHQAGVQEPSDSAHITAESEIGALAIQKAASPSWEEEQRSAALRGNAEAFAQDIAAVPALSHRRHWELPPDDELWPVKLSLLTAVSSVGLLLVVAVGAQVRRSRRHVHMADRQLEWAEAVEILDAFPEET